MGDPHETLSPSYLATDFVAGAILSSIRRGTMPGPEEAGTLDRRPLIDLLRDRVRDTDRDLLVKIVGERGDEVAGLAASLLRHEIDSELFDFYARRWRGSPPYLKNRLMWRMLDYDELRPEWHHHFFEFVRQNWEVFREFNIVFYSGSGVASRSIGERLGDPSFPRSKKWVYACCVPEVVPPGRTANKLLELTRETGDGFAGMVVDYLRRRFAASPDGEVLSWSVPDAPVPASPLVYVTKAVLERLREGRRPNERCAERLGRAAIADAIRTLTRPGDSRWIEAGRTDERSEVAHFYSRLVGASGSRRGVG